MKPIILLIELLIMFIVLESCEHRQVIPDKEEITKIIAETIKQDSLDNKIFINLNLVNRYNYQLDSDRMLRNITPPPRNEKGEPFLFYYFKSDKENLLGLNQLDSIFVLEQIARNKDIALVMKLLPNNYKYKKIPVFKYKDSKMYQFLIPLFNKKNDFAIVEYDYVCPGCGRGRIVYLQKIKGKWIKVDTFNTWQS